MTACMARFLSGPQSSQSQGCWPPFSSLGNKSLGLILCLPTQWVLDGYRVSQGVSRAACAPGGTRGSSAAWGGRMPHSRHVWGRKHPEERAQSGAQKMRTLSSLASFPGTGQELVLVCLVRRTAEARTVSTAGRLCPGWVGYIPRTNGCGENRFSMFLPCPFLFGTWCKPCLGVNPP